MKKPKRHGQQGQPLGLSSHLTRQDFPFNVANGFLFGHAQVISGLQVQPEFRASAKVTGKPQGSVGGDAALFTHDVIDTRGGNLKGDGQGVGSHAQWVQVFLTQDFTGMDRVQRVTCKHVAKVGVVKVLGVDGGHGLASVVIGDFNIVGVIVFKPETNTPLVIDPDAPLSRPIATQLFQAVAGRVTQVVNAYRSVQQHELTQCQSLEVNRPLPDLPTSEDSGGVLASERLDHCLNCITQRVKRKALRG